MGKSVKIVSPIDGSIVAERPVADDGAIEAALARSKVAGPAWRRVPITERARVCTAAVDAMLSMEPEIVPELARQMGRPVRSGGGELRGFEERARYMIAIAEKALAPLVPEPKPGFRRYVTREPLGAVLVVAPWNFPYLTAVNAVIPALMAGNTVILKHAQQTLLAGERFARAFAAAGLPEGVFQNLVLDHGQTERLIASGSVDWVNFTGSVDGGRSMERAAAGTFTGLGLELGGKDPAYVRHDVDLDAAIEGLVDGAFFNSGQSCCGVERIYVDRAVFDPFVAGFVDLAKAYVLGDPLDPRDDLGADGARVRGRGGARPDRRRPARRGAGADRPGRLSPRRARLGLFEPAGAGRRRSFDGGDGRRELRPRGRDHGRRRGGGGGAADER